MGRILLVRHGQASFGSSDYDRLSPIGTRQASLLGERLRASGWRIDHTVTGSLKRHRQTAEACTAAWSDDSRPGGEWRVDSGFDEYDADEVMARCHPRIPDMQALTRHLAEHRYPKQEFEKLFNQAMRRWMGGAHDKDYREPWKRFQRRCVEALQRAAETAGRSRTIVIFTSGGPIAVMCQHLLGLSDRRTFDLNFSIVNSAVTGLLYRPGRISLNYLNNHAHLEQAGTPDIITYR